MLQLNMFGSHSTATLSSCGRYRYELGRRWSGGPQLEWVMLNPSTADADREDPTIRRCVRFARAWGFGGIVVHNLFAWRATHPRELARVGDPVGPRNREFLCGAKADLTVVAWGASPAAVEWWAGRPNEWQQEILLSRPRLMCLGINGNGSPKHPLYVPSSAEACPWFPDTSVGVH